jgi:hypothetical protein
MYCHIKEKFDASSIIVEQITIKDLEGENRLILRAPFKNLFAVLLVLIALLMLMKIL